MQTIKVHTDTARDLDLTVVMVAEKASELAVVLVMDGVGDLDLVVVTDAVVEGVVEA